MTAAERGPWQYAQEPWEQMEEEPDRWYARFQVYLELGVLRTLKMTAQVVGERTRGRPLALTGDWTYAAQRWYWRGRAHAWDVRQRELLALSERNTRIALHHRRVDRMEDALDAVCEALDAADLVSLTRDQARAMLPQMRVFFRDLMVAERQEFERGDYERDDPDATLRITADDLAQAQRLLDAEAGRDGPGSERRRLEAAPAPTRAAVLRRRTAGTPVLSVCMGPDPGLGLELAHLRELRTAAGFDFIRVLNPTRAKLANHLGRERSLGRPVELLHLGVPVGEEGILFSNGPAGEAWLRKHLRDVRVLLLAGGGVEHVATALEFVPCVVSLDAALTPGERVQAALEFWRRIGTDQELVGARRPAEAGGASRLTDGDGDQPPVTLK